MTKRAQTDHPVHDLIAARWSPYSFADRPLEANDLLSILEAARWAPSSYNEQPWSYLIATRDQDDAFKAMLTCLVEPNRAWAQHAAVLLLGVASLRFTRNGKPNAAAMHDLGLAAANLSLEATARGIAVHQMIGILPDQARDLYQIPEHHDAVTALALGYPGERVGLDPALYQRDQAPRTRKALGDFVFAERFGNPARCVS